MFLKKALSADADAAIREKLQQKLDDWQRDKYGVWKNSFTNLAARKRGGDTTAFDRFKR